MASVGTTEERLILILLKEHLEKQKKDFQEMLADQMRIQQGLIRRGQRLMLKKLNEHLHYSPDGPGAQEAKESFNKKRKTEES